MIYPNLDGTFTCVLADAESMIFMEAVLVTLESSTTSLGGFTYRTSPVELNEALHHYFAGMREDHLKTWGVWDAWVHQVEVSELHDVGTGTTQTIYSFTDCKQKYNNIEKYVHTVIETNRTYKLPEPNLDFDFWSNVTNVEHKCNVTSITRFGESTKTVHEALYDMIYAGNATYRLYKDGKVYTDSDPEKFTCLNGIEGLKLYLKTHFSGKVIKSDHTKVHFGNATYLWYHDLTVDKNDTGAVMNEDNEVITMDGLVGLRKFLAPSYKIVIVNGVTYHLNDDGSITNIHGKVILAEGGLAALKLFLTPQYTTYVINDLTYRVYVNGTVTETDGKLVIAAGGVEGLLKHLSFINSSTHMLKTNTTVIVNGVYYRILSNGTVTDLDGVIIHLTGGIEALKRKLVSYNITSINGEDFKIFYDGKVTFTNGTVLAEEGGVEALKLWFSATHDLHFTVVNMCDGNLLKLFSNDSVTTLDGTLLDSNGGVSYLKDLCSDFNFT